MKILFLCVANSARSQIAEGLAKKILGSAHEIHSAGSEPSGRVNPFAIKVLQENGIDTSQMKSKSCDDLPEKFIRELDYIITLCAEEICPVLATSAKKLHWPLPDPAAIIGNDDVKLEAFRKTRDAIKTKLEDNLHFMS